MPDSQSPEVVPVHVAGTTPYPWPWNGVLDPAGTAVVVVTPTATNAPIGAAARPTLGAALAVIDAVRNSGGAVVRVHTAPPRRAATVAAFFPGLEVDEESTSAGVDGFYGSALESILRRRGIDRLVLVGVGIETCLHSTMRSANDRGYECLLVVDACAAYDSTLVAPAVSMIEMSGGIFGAVGTSTAVIDAFTTSKGELP